MKNKEKTNEQLDDKTKFINETMEKYKNASIEEITKALLLLKLYDKTYELYDKVIKVNESHFLELEETEQLFEKHFDNPPLKFEELKRGMNCYVIDGVFRTTALISNLNNDGTVTCVYIDRFGNSMRTTVWFEDCEFYEREVSASDN